VKPGDLVKVTRLFEPTCDGIIINENRVVYCAHDKFEVLLRDGTTTWVYDYQLKVLE